MLDYQPQGWKLNELVVSGIRAVEEVLRSELSCQILYIEKDKDKARIERLISLAKRRGLRVSYVPREFLDRWGRHHQGVMLTLASKSFVSWQEMVTFARKKEEAPLILALDGVEDVGNFGAIIRSAEALGVHGVVIPKRRSASITSTVVRASAGAISHLPMERVTNMASALRNMKKEGLWVVGTHLEEGGNPWEVDLTIPIVLVMGNEQRGISRVVKESCDFLVKIPLKGKVGSLNVSAATAALLYEVLRQRSLHH